MQKLDADSLFQTWLYSSDSERKDLYIAVQLLYRKHYLSLRQYHKFIAHTERIMYTRND